jgi:hypothetical protein
MVCLRAGHFFPTVLLILASLTAQALPAQVQTLPSQQIPEARPTSPPIMPQPAETPTPGSSPFQLPGSQGNTREIPLPEVFRGCWSGTVPRLDSMQPLSADMGRLIWLTKTYTLCYKQAGYNGNWQLTFAENAVADSREVIDQRQAIKVKSVSGANHAELTAYLHFRTHGFVGFGGIARPSTLDELAHLHCQVRPELNLMAVSASVFVEANGEPFAEVTWHTMLSRAGGETTGND